MEQLSEKSCSVCNSIYSFSYELQFWRTKWSETYLKWLPPKSYKIEVSKIKRQLCGDFREIIGPSEEWGRTLSILMG